MDTIALILAAGRGRRSGLATPKQYQPLGGRTVLAWSLSAFASHPKVTAVLPVIHPDDADAFTATRAALPPAHTAKLLAPVHGGAERQDTVRLGLEALEDRAPARVMIHDAARPFVSADVIDRVFEALETSPAAIAALPVTDTVKRATPGEAPRIAETLPRETLWRAQTPQGFHYAPILAAHRAAAGRALTDDAAVAEAAGLEVALAPGAPDNMKLTVAEDFGMAETLIARQAGASPEPRALETRTGQGFDVHAFAPGDHVMLCGVRLDHSHALAGHSDADVGLHALTDALLGALAAGDIGAHFPPSDPQWAGAASDQFLAHARDLVGQRDGVIRHVDVTLICERPKIGPHREAMRARIANILAIAIDRVSVKATTTEQLGFTGRREGIAAMATATLALPMTDPTAPE